jgi:Ser/Thr protein kinase RdoA (MazF antagonist)
MFKQDAGVIHDALVRHWKLPEPLDLSDSLQGGVTADVWLVTDSDGNRYVAKFIYDSQARAEAGLRVAEQVEANSDLTAGAPRRTHAGELTVMLPSVPDEKHPLALLNYVAGTPATLGPEECADLLVDVQAAVAKTHVPTTHNVFDYLGDDSIDIAYADQIRPVLHECVDQVLTTEGLTWGTCYGDGPEAIRTEHGIGLVDWGGVLHGPLLWDVAQWMRYIVREEDRQRYLSAYRARTSLPPDELTHLGKFTRLCQAHELRFRAFRVLHADHYSDSREKDAEAVASLALSLGVQLSDSAAYTRPR